MTPAPRPFQSLPAQAFACIYADPPWRFDTWSERGAGRSERRHYAAMTVQEIADLPVLSLADPRGCALLLWVRNPMIEGGLAVMRAWGFSFRAVAFTWAKLNPSGAGWHAGTGHWTRQNTEMCLLGIRGRVARRMRDVPELVVAPRREHSRKPDEIRGRIERLVGGPYVELFSRASAPSPMWMVWGDQLGLF